MAASSLKVVSVPASLALSPITYDFAQIEIQLMSVSDFSTILDNPRQRNQHLRLDKPHLKTTHPAHAIVAIAVLPDGRQFKVDAHTRTALWLLGRLTPPGALFVVTYHVDTIEDVKALYDAYDNRNAAKQAVDTMQSATREFSIGFKSKWLEKGEFSGLMNFAAARFRNAPATPFKRVEFFKNEMKLFDSISPAKEKFPIGIGAAAILFLRKHGAGAVPFLRAYNNGDGIRSGAKRNCVVYLEEYLAGERKNKTMAGRSKNAMHCAAALGCMEASFAGSLRQKAPKALSIGDYVATIK